MILKNIDFKLGIVTYNEFNIDPTISYKKQIQELDQDLLLVKYPNGYLIDLCWLPDWNQNGRFVIRIIKNEDWENPAYRKETRNFLRLEEYLQKCIDLATDLATKNQDLSDLKKLNMYSQYANFNFDRSDFKVFFGEESVFDMESGAFHYSIKLEHGFELSLYTLAIDEFVAITLRHESLQSPIFDIGFDEIVKIKLDKREDLDYVGLDLYKNNQEPSTSPKPFLSISIKPNVSITLGV